MINIGCKFPIFTEILMSKKVKQLFLSLRIILLRFLGGKYSLNFSTRSEVENNTIGWTLQQVDFTMKYLRFLITIAKSKWQKQKQQQQQKLSDTLMQTSWDHRPEIVISLGNRIRK